jgi:F-type H+-transporting ATPase subunit a
MPGVPKVMRIVLAPIISLIAIFFINDSFVCKHFAGHIVLMSIIGLMFISKAGWEAVYHLIVICVLVDIAFLQAYIFTSGGARKRTKTPTTFLSRYTTINN